MKKLFVIIAFIVSCMTLQSQNVAFVDYKWQSDITIYVTNNKWQADTKVKFVDYDAYESSEEMLDDVLKTGELILTVPLYIISSYA